MRLPQTPGIGAAELQTILEELDRIVGGGGADPSPPPAAIDRELTLEEKLELLCQPPARELEPSPSPKPPAAPKLSPALKLEPPTLSAPPRSQAAQTASGPRPERELPAPKAEAKAAAPARPDEVPADASPEQVRRIALICTPDAAEELAALMSYLQEIGREIAHPIFLRTEFVYTVDAEIQPATIALKARLSEAMAAVAIFKGFDRARLERIQTEFGKTRVHYHPVDADRIRDRSVLIEIMTDLLITDPRRSDGGYEWDGHGFDETHGVRR